MLKRATSVTSVSGPAHKRPHSDKPLAFSPPKVASEAAANATDANPPFFRLLKVLDHAAVHPGKGSCVAYWMRMGDLRSQSCPLIVHLCLFSFSST